ncbi:rhodanese-like domain-containing protein [Thermodesulfobacteriota bacterium]
MGPGLILRDSLIVVALSAAVALAFNGFRPAGLEFVASRDYEIFVPCLEPGGEAGMLAPSEIRWDSPTDLVLDGRSSEDHESWHPEGVRNVPFDFLQPVPEDVLREIAGSRAQRVIVIGGDRVPDTGEELARELGGRGIKNVYFVKGGMASVRDQIVEE